MQSKTYPTKACPHYCFCACQRS